MPTDGQRPRVTFSRARAALASGKWSVVALVVCFVVTGLIVPAAVRMPRWVEVELVVAAWWAVWVGGLTYLLHSTCGVSDDATAPSGPSWLRRSSKTTRPAGGADGPDGCWHLADPGCLDLSIAGEGCGQAVLIIAGVVLIFFGLSLLVELLIPGLAFLMYVLVRGMLARAVAGRDDCQGNLLRSAIWGTFWATLYTLPLALAVWGIHALRAGGS
jgi:hypothetical protein